MIIKSLSDKKNQGVLQPSPDRGMKEENEWQTKDQTTDIMGRSSSQWSKKKINYSEVESGNVSDQQEVKKQKVELQGEFRKIKPPTFDGEDEEVVEASLIIMNKYFQVYRYTNNFKARLAIYQLREKATLWWEEVKNVCNLGDQDVTWGSF